MPHGAMREFITIANDHPSLSVDQEALAALLEHVATEEARSIVDLTVVLTGHDAVLALNRQYLEHDYITDVLSFDLSDDASRAFIDGEIYIDLDTARERHEEFEVSFEAEVFRYAVHGLLHLVGYEDQTPDEKERMRTLEDRYLGR